MSCLQGEPGAGEIAKLGTRGVGSIMPAVDDGSATVAVLDDAYPRETNEAYAAVPVDGADPSAFVQWPTTLGVAEGAAMGAVLVVAGDDGAAVVIDD